MITCRIACSKRRLHHLPIYGIAWFLHCTIYQCCSVTEAQFLHGTLRLPARRCCQFSRAKDKSTNKRNKKPKKKDNGQTSQFYTKQTNIAFVCTDIANFIYGPHDKSQNKCKNQNQKTQQQTKLCKFLVPQTKVQTNVTNKQTQMTIFWAPRQNTNTKLTSYHKSLMNKCTKETKKDKIPLVCRLMLPFF